MGVDESRLRARLPLDLAKRDGVAFGQHLLDSRAQLDGPEGNLEVLERTPDVTLSEAEQRARLEIRDRERAVYVDGEECDRHRVCRSVPHDIVIGTDG